MKKRIFPSGRSRIAVFLSVVLALSLFAGCAATGEKGPPASDFTDGVRQYYERRSETDTAHDYSHMSLETLGAMDAGTLTNAVDTEELRIELTGAVHCGSMVELVLRVTAKKLDTVLFDGGTPKNYRFGYESFLLPPEVNRFDAVNVAYTYSDENGALAPNQFELHYWLLQYPGAPDTFTLTLKDLGVYSPQFTPEYEESWTVEVTFTGASDAARTVEPKADLSIHGDAFVLESAEISPFLCIFQLSQGETGSETYAEFLRDAKECTLTLTDGTVLDASFFHAEFSQQDDFRFFLEFFAPIDAASIASVTMFGTDIPLS